MIKLAAWVWLLCGIAVSAETIWVAQSAAGGDTGADAGNAHGVSWFNTAGNWGGGGSDIDPGDTVMLSGTITNALVVQGSGSSGNPITIQFAPGAKLSAPTWTSSGAFVGSSKSFIVLDGGSDGVIESTDNGGARTYQNDDRHILLSNCDSWVIKNLECRDVYAPASSTVDSNSYGRAVYSIYASDLLLSNCTFRSGGKIVTVSYGAGDEDVSIVDCTISNAIVGITVGSSGAGATLNRVTISGNTIQNGTNWWGSWNGDTVWHHIDAVHTFSAHSSSYISNLVVSANVCGPDNPVRDTGTEITSIATAWLYVEASGGGFIAAPQIINNVLTVQSGDGQGVSLGLVAVKAGQSPLIANNTFVGNGDNSGVYIFSGVTDFQAYNNIFTNLNIGINDNSATVVTDNNLFSGCTYAGRITSTYYSSLANWQTGLGGCPGSGNECSGVADAPGFVGSGDYSLQAGSAAVDAGTDLSAYFSTDILGVSRPSGSAWDIGAYEFEQGVGNSYQDSLDPQGRPWKLWIGVQ